MIKRFRNVARAAAVGTTLWFSALAAAQSPAADQLDLLRNLSPDQQQSILQQLGGQSSGLPAGRDAARQSRIPQEDAEARTSKSRQDEDDEPLIPVFKPGDTVLVQIAVPEERPERAQGALPAGATSQAVPGVQLDSNGKPVGQAPLPQSDVESRRYQAPVEQNEAERKKLQDLVDLVRSRNPYRLDRSALLNLPGFAPIAVGGLNEAQGTLRVSAEPALLRFDIKLVRLPLAKTGIDGLKPFGYDLFDEPPSRFAPLTDLPVPADYVIGPGDELSVQLYGNNQNRSLPLVVSREGSVNFPGLGPIRVAGLSFNAARQTIESRVSQQMIGVRASVSMGELRTIRVFVLGEVKQPGSHAVTGLSTVTSALFASGGVKPIGSLRNIQLKRQGRLVRELDLYDLLMQGDTSDDVNLLPGDVIFIPPVGPTVSVDGEVKRPAIYELRGESSLAQVVIIAGGLTPEADPTRGSLTRIDVAGRRVVSAVNLAEGAQGIPAVGNGDILRISRLRPQIDAGVTLDGHVWRPGPVAWRQGLRLSEVVSSVDELKPDADQHYLLIRREAGPDRRVSVLSADLGAALSAPGSDFDVVLQPRDRLTVFDLGPGRERIIKPVLDELRLQSELTRPTEVVRVEGRVKVPGEYPLEPGMTVRDLLRAGGNLLSSAYGGKAELARYTVGDSGTRQSELIDIDLAAVRRGEGGANVELRPFDYLLVKETPEWDNQELVTLKGEVRFPGVYPIRRGETLRRLLDRAGGLTSVAFPRGSAFTRKELKEREQQQLDRLGDRMQMDIATLSLQGAAANQTGASQALLAGQSLLSQLQSTKAVGRLVIDLPGLMTANEGGPKDIILRDGDELVVPKLRQEVTVIGEVQNPTSHLHASLLKRDDYVNLSGGTTRKADRRHIYVVRADGNVLSARRSLFARSYDPAIMAGDTIVVPLDTERMPKLPFWQAVTQIIYNLAVSVAAINSF